MSSSVGSVCICTCVHVCAHLYVCTCMCVFACMWILRMGQDWGDHWDRSKINKLGSQERADSVTHHVFFFLIILFVSTKENLCNLKNEDSHTFLWELFETEKAASMSEHSPPAPWGPDKWGWVLSVLFCSLAASGHALEVKRSPPEVVSPWGDWRLTPLSHLHKGSVPSLLSKETFRENTLVMGFHECDREQTWISKFYSAKVLLTILDTPQETWQ